MNTNHPHSEAISPDGSPAHSTPSATLKDWLGLMRIANLPSAISNILMGFLMIQGSWQPTIPLVLLILASSCLYIGGMVLNDICDVEVDRQQQRNRPLVTGVIGLAHAKLLVGLLVATAIGLAIAIDQMSPETGNRTLIVVCVLAICVFLYDKFLKKTPLAPIVMGTCRSLNVLLGASVIPVGFEFGASQILGWPITICWLALAVGVLIAGITWFARNEAGESKPVMLIPSAAVLLAGLAGIAAITYVPSSFPVFAQPLDQFFPFLILLISITILRRLIVAIMTCTPGTVQAAVIASLRSLIFLDAAVCLLRRPDHPEFALAVLALLIPSLLLGRWFRQT